MADESQLKAGDVVVLKSGGPKMTVSSQTARGWQCTWFLAGVLSRDEFVKEALTLAAD
jgi:uncharacterized protein YodC (DUF2158 family)